MYLTTIEHEGREWTVHITVVPDASQPAALAFAFRHRSGDGEEMVRTWEASGAALHALYELGNEFSEEVLLEQLAHALAKEQTADPVGVGTSAPEQREHGFQ